MMKRIFAICLIAALALCGFALAEDIQGSFEDGCYVITMKVDDEAWVADEMAQDDTVVRLESAEYADGVFTVKYAPVGDGEVTVAVRHFKGIACDEMHTWDLDVKDGAVQEVIGGSYTASPDPSDFDAYLLGDWETEDGMTFMTVSKNPGGAAWDVEIMSQEDGHSYDFVTTVYFDCELDTFVYDKGKFWRASTGDAGAEDVPDEATQAGTTGRFAFVGDEEELHIDWYDDQGESVLFKRHQSDYTYFPESEDYVGEWVAGEYTLEIVHSKDDYNVYNCSVTRIDSNGRTGTDWLYDSCAYDDVGKALSCEMIGVQMNFTRDKSGEIVYSEEVFTDGAASFALNKDGTLTWTNFKEAPGEDEIVFTKTSAQHYEAEGIAFDYDGNAFEITLDDIGDNDEHQLILTGKNGDWGDTWIRFYTPGLTEADPMPTLEEMKAQRPDVEFTQGGWNGFEDVIQYSDGNEHTFLVPLTDGGALTVGVGVEEIQDEDVAMGRDDQISAVLDSLKIVAETVEGSELYTEEDMGEAEDIVQAEVDSWEGIELVSLSYGGDAENNEANIDWLSDLNGKKYAQVLEFLANIRTAEDFQGSLEPNTDYYDYQFWLARTEGGEWELITWGY